MFTNETLKMNHIKDMERVKLNREKYLAQRVAKSQSMQSSSKNEESPFININLKNKSPETTILASFLFL